METVELEIERRTVTGKGFARRLRAEGKVPGVLYGPRRTTSQIVVPREQLDRRIVHLEGSHLIKLIHPNGSDADLHDRMVLVRELQRHPVTGAVLHADFYEVDLTERLTVSVPLHFTGRAAGVVAGGILQPVLREISVECLPTEIPDFIDVDVSGLGIHDALHVSELLLPERVTPVDEQTRTVVTVVPPSVEVKPTTVEPGAEAVPAEAAGGEAAAPKKPGEGGTA